MELREDTTCEKKISNKKLEKIIRKNPRVDSIGTKLLV